MQHLWDMLENSEPKFKHEQDIFLTYRNQIRLIQFLMALRDDFENTRSSLLRRQPLPTMDSALTELISEETRLAMTRTHRQDTIVAATPKHRTNSASPCHRCGRTNHLVAQCKANFHSNGTRL